MQIKEFIYSSTYSMVFFNTGLDFQSCFFDTYKLYIYIYVAPFVSNIFTSKSVLTIAETHTL